MNALVHERQTARTKSICYRIQGDRATALAFRAVFRMIKCGELKTTAAVQAELKRRGLDTK